MSVWESRARRQAPRACASIYFFTFRHNLHFARPPAPRWREAGVSLRDKTDRSSNKAAPRDPHDTSTGQNDRQALPASRHSTHMRLLYQPSLSHHALSPHTSRILLLLILSYPPYRSRKTLAAPTILLPLSSEKEEGKSTARHGTHSPEHATHHTTTHALGHSLTSSDDNTT